MCDAKDGLLVRALGINQLRVTLHRSHRLVPPHPGRIQTLDDPTGQSRVQIRVLILMLARDSISVLRVC